MGYKRECLTSATISHTSISETDTVTFEANLVTVWKKWVGAFPKYINAKWIQIVPTGIWKQYINSILHEVNILTIHIFQEKINKIWWREYSYMNIWERGQLSNLRGLIGKVRE